MITDPLITESDLYREIHAIGEAQGKAEQGLRSVQYMLDKEECYSKDE